MTTACPRCGGRLYRDADNDLSCSLGCGNVVYATVALDVPAQTRRDYSAAYCSRGHLRTEASTYVNTNGSTRCRVCKRRGESERMAQKAVAG